MKIDRILIIIQRSNGDVFLSSVLINALYEHCNKPQIDLLINDDTLAIAETLKNIDKIHLFSYKKKKENRLKQEFDIIKTIYRKYDLSINLTASDRSVLYALLASRYSVSAIEKNGKKSWWKKIFLTKNYLFDTSKHIIQNNTSSLKLLGINNSKFPLTANYSEQIKAAVIKELHKLKIKKFIIFHPSAQYKYKIYPKQLRDKLLELLNDLNIPIVITGAKSKIDLQIKSALPKYENVYDFIGKTSLEELIALSELSSAYIGMDTLNMHIAAALDKRVFAIFGPTLPQIWSPWCSKLQCAATSNSPIQTYGNITLFQADMPCVACGKAGCDDQGGKSDCLKQIAPKTIFNEVKKWLMKSA